MCPAHEYACDPPSLRERKKRIERESDAERDSEIEMGRERRGKARPHLFPFTGFSTLKEHISVSSMVIMAPALSNSPQ